MGGKEFRGFLEGWLGKEVTVINPESYKQTALGKGLTFQSYPATLSEIGADYVKFTFSSMKGESQTAVEQIVPLVNVKRVSLWGEEKLVHI